MTDNPYKAAGRLAKRLSVRSDHGERGDDFGIAELRGTVWGHASWTSGEHGLIYAVTLQGDDAGWSLTAAGNGVLKTLAGAAMDPATAHQYIVTADSADGRRLAAWQMVNHLGTVAS